MSWAVATCLFWAAVLSITFPRMLQVLAPVGAFCFYAGLNVVALVMLFSFMPETKQRTLEELDYIFAISTRKFMSHQYGTVLPWWFKTWILRRKLGPCPSLWTFDGHVAGDDEFVETVRKGSVAHPEAGRNGSIVDKIRKH